MDNAIRQHQVLNRSTNLEYHKAKDKAHDSGEYTAGFDSLVTVKARFMELRPACKSAWRLINRPTVRPMTTPYTQHR
jgi:hypothetical protein